MRVATAVFLSFILFIITIVKSDDESVDEKNDEVTQNETEVENSTSALNETVISDLNDTDLDVKIDDNCPDCRNKTSGSNNFTINKTIGMLCLVFGIFVGWPLHNS